MVSLGLCAALVLAAPGSATPAEAPAAASTATPVGPDGVIPAFPDAPPYRPPAPETPPPPPPDGLLVSGNYLHISPGIVGFTPIADAGAIAYVWGIAGGRYFTAGRRFAAALGGFGEHSIVRYLPGECSEECSASNQHGMRLGAELRLGARWRRVFVYGVGRMGAELSFDYDLIDYDEAGYQTSEHRGVYPWFVGSAGAGAQGLIGKRFLIGGENSFDIGGDAFFLVRLRLIVGVRF